MSNNIGYIKIPRQFLNSPNWKSLSLEYRHIYMTILSNAAYERTTQNDHGKIIKINPGQFLITYRELERLCDVEKIDKSKIERALKRFVKIGFLVFKTGQDSGLTKTLITITEPTICKEWFDINETVNETVNETRTRQERDTKEEVKKERRKEEQYISREALKEKIEPLKFSEENNDKEFLEKTGSDSELNITYTIRQTKTDDVDTKSNELEKKETKTKQKKSKAKIESEEYKRSLKERRKNIHTSEEEHVNFIATLGVELTEKCYDELSIWKKSKTDAGKHKEVEAHTDSYRIVKWVIEKVKEKDSKSSIQPNSLEENKKYAQQVLNSFFNQNYKIEVLSKSIEFTPQRGQAPPDIVNYSEKGFREQIENILKKREFKRRTEMMEKI